MEFYSTPFTLHQLLSETMKKVIYLLTIIIYCATLSAQNNDTYRAELLEGKDWFIVFNDSERENCPPQGVHIKNNILTAFAYFDNNRQELKSSYYLSTTLDKTFIPSKVGKCTSGKYLIINDSSGLMCAEILKLNETEMVLHCYWTNRQLSFTTKRPE